MGNNGILKKLKKTLEDIYNDFRSRIDPEPWKKAVKEAYSEAPDETAVQVVDFMLTHECVPSKVWRAVCHAADITNRPVALSDIYSNAAINGILDRMSGTDPLRYAYISSDSSDDEVKHIMDTAEAAQRYMEKGQIYLAEKAVNDLSRFCPTHPDVLDMRKKLADIRCTGGVDVVRDMMPFRSQARDGMRDACNKSDTEAAAQRLENAIADNYKCYEAYYPLGMIYLKNSDIQKADYVAEVLLDLGHESVDACLLKGRVLEAQEKTEDAFFYYDRACRIGRADAGSREAAGKASKEASADALKEASHERTRLLNEFEPEYTEYEPATDTKSEPKRNYLDNEESAAIEVVKETDNLIKLGRLTEAYYELVKRSQEFSRSELLKFKKALALYLMKKEPEAREVFLAVGENSPLYERAGYLVSDIEFNIVENKKFESISIPELAGIFFNTGKYAEALAAFKQTDESDMTARMWSQRARCEAEEGMLNAAVHSIDMALKKDFRLEEAYELAALIYQAKGENENALAIYDEAVKMSASRGNTRACSLKAALLYGMGRQREVLEFRNSLENRGVPASSADGYAGLVQIYGKPGDIAQGLEYLERAITSGASETRFYTAAVSACLARRQYFRAMLYVEKGLEKADEPEALYTDKCKALYLSGKLDAAFTNAGTLLTKDPESAEVHYIMGCIHSDRGEEREAVKWLKSAAEINKEDHKYAYAVADKCFCTGDTASALTYYSRAIMLDSSDHISFKRRALIYIMRDEDEKAVEDIKCAMLLKPDDPEIYMMLGDILSGYELEDDLDVEGSTDNMTGPAEPSSDAAENSDDKSVTAEDESENDAADAGSGSENSSEDHENKDDGEKDAEYYYSKAIELDPNYRQAYISRAGFYVENRRLDDALKDIQKAVSLDENEGDAYMTRGIIHHLRSEDVQAINDFERAAQTERFALQAYSYIAKCNNALRDYNAAVEAADAGIAIDSSFLNLYVNRGVALFNLGKYHQAAEDFKRVIQKKNEVNTAAVETSYRFSGMTNEKLGNKEEALSDYRMLIKYNPDHPDIKQRISELESQLEANEKKHRFSFFKRKKGSED